MGRARADKWITKSSVSIAMRLGETRRGRRLRLDAEHLTLEVYHCKVPSIMMENDHGIALIDANGFDSWVLVKAQGKHPEKTKEKVFQCLSRFVGIAFYHAHTQAPLKCMDFHE